MSEDRTSSELACEINTENVGEILEPYRQRLRRMIDLRMDPRVRGRIDSSDVIQEAFIEVVDRLASYRRSPDVPFYLWVRFITGQKLLQLHRQHLAAKKRSVVREVEIQFGGAPAASSAVLASALAATGLTSPSGAAMREDEVARLERALEHLKPADREILVLRHFEHLSNSEIAHVLEMTEAAASIRYWRATARLREVLDRA